MTNAFWKHLLITIIFYQLESCKLNMTQDYSEWIFITGF